MKHFYKDKRNGKIQGVCAGFAYTLDMNITIVRILYIVGLFAAFPVFFIGYFLLAMILNDRVDNKYDSVQKPHHHNDEQQRQRDKSHYLQQLDKLEQHFQLIEKHIDPLEYYVISDEFTLKRKLWELE